MFEDKGIIDDDKGIIDDIVYVRAHHESCAMTCDISLVKAAMYC
jgi:hypothetical protein